MESAKCITVFTIVRYPTWAIPFAFFSMAVFRISLWLNQKISFWKLMGTGKNGGFDKTPSWKQWALLAVTNQDYMHSYKNPEKLYGSFILKYWNFFQCKKITFLLEPLEGHGYWNGKTVFGQLPQKTVYMGEIAVLTRAAIRLKKLKRFWMHVPAVAREVAAAHGLLYSYSIGEMPLMKQATFSVWKNKEHMQNFAYAMKNHKTTIRKTHEEKWYKESMFVRFKVLDIQMS